MGHTGERGQVAVEQAMVVPMVVFLLLGTVQLGMIQHARLMGEYAAFNAARAGIVYNGDEGYMSRAAFLSLLPTMGRSDSWSAVGDFFTSKEALKALLLGTLGMPLVEAKIIDPDAKLALLASKGRHLGGSQLDFDDYRPEVAEANLLSVRVRYYYRMRIPFANWMVQTIWFAHRSSLLSLYEGVNFVAPEAGVHQASNLAALADSVAEVRWVAAARQGGEFYFPITTWYTMRMQSNLYKETLEGSKSGGIGGLLGRILDSFLE